MFEKQKVNGIFTFVVIACLIFVCIIINRNLTIKQLKIEKEELISQLETTKKAIENPAVTKEGATVVKVIEKKINLTKEQKEAIASKYEMDIANLEEIIRSLTEKVIEVSKEGKSESKPVIPQHIQVWKDSSRWLGNVHYYKDNSFSFGFAYRPFVNYNIYTGIELEQKPSGSQTVGITVAIGF